MARAVRIDLLPTETFELLWNDALGPVLVPEHRFHPKRRWQFDYALPDSRVGIEVEGGTWVSGRHSRGSGYAKDCAKYNTAAELGWAVYRLTTDMLEQEGPRWIQRIIALCRERNPSL